MTHPDLDAVRTLIDDETDRARQDMPPLDVLIATAHARRRHRRGAALGAVLGATMVAGAVGLTFAWNDQPPSVDIASTSSSSSFQSAGDDLPAHPRPDQVAERLAEILNAQGRDGGGTWISEEKTLNIYVAGPAAGKDATVDEIQTLADDLTSAVDFTVEVHAGGLRTEAQLVSTMDVVADTKSYDPDGAVRIRAMRIDHKTGQVEVDVTSQAAADIVEKTFGAAVRTQVKAPRTQEEIDEMFQGGNPPSPTPARN